MDRRQFLKTCAGLCGGASLLPFLGIENSAEAQTVKRGLLGIRNSPWFRTSARNTLTCTLCPKECTLSSGQRGVCRVRENRQGKGVTLTYGNPCLVQIDPVERIPFFHVLPASRTLSIATAGCPLECMFCEVWDMALIRPEDIHAYDMPPPEVIRFAQSAKARAISYAFGEPAAFFEFMLDTAILARKAGLLNLLHTSGYISPPALQELIPYLDAVNFDLKSIDPSFYRKYCGAPDMGPILDNLRRLVQARVHVEITHIVIPTLNDDSSSLERLVQWIRTELGASIPLHFARFYPLYKLTNLPPTPVTVLENAYSIARTAGLQYVYLAKITGHRTEHTYCPRCGNSVISRVGFMVGKIHLNKGRCQFCQQAIPGRWEP